MFVSIGLISPNESVEKLSFPLQKGLNYRTPWEVFWKETGGALAICNLPAELCWQSFFSKWKTLCHSGTT
jgi:hypothetical protein